MPRDGRATMRREGAVRMAGSVEVLGDHTNEWLEAIGPAVARALDAVGMAAEGHAKAKCPVDTGRLRNSITHARAGAMSEVIGTNVEYAPHVGLGTPRQKKQPFLTPAATEHADEYRAIIRGALGA